MQRKFPLVTGEIYHIFNKSIAHYVIFNSAKEYQRMFKTLRYYKNRETDTKLSLHLRSGLNQKETLPINFSNRIQASTPVEIIAYCLMPTHFHLILKQLKDNGITEFAGNIQNSYTRYFNLRHNRKGPLWEGRFKNVLVKDEKQFLHLTRYIHLNPTTANISQHPEDWEFSSYIEYFSSGNKKNLCDFKQYLDIGPAEYQDFVNDRIAYQRELAVIKHIILE